jgi:CHASE2 domain-containing sensor protein
VDCIHSKPSSSGPTTGGLSHTARPDTARTDIALVEIDEYSLRNLQPNAGRWPWPRAVHSMLIDYLARAPAKVIAYDVLFTEADTRTGFEFGGTTWSGAESDKALADSIKAAGNVLLLADASYDTKTPDAVLPDEGYRLDISGILDREGVLPPFPALAQAAAGLGHNLFILDPDGPLRHMTPFVRAQQRALASLGTAAALRAAGIGPGDVRLEGTALRLGDRRMPLSWRRVDREGGVLQHLWALIDFRGPALLDDLRSRTYPTYTFFDLLLSENQLLTKETPKVDPSIFRDKIVFVGTTASGLLDTFESPFAHGKMPGIQIHAAVADDICRIDSCVRRPHGCGSCRSLRRHSGSAWRRRCCRRGGRHSPRFAVMALVAWWATFLFARRRLVQPHTARSGIVVRAPGRRRLPVLLRGPREEKSQTALRPICVEGRVRRADGEPGPGPSWRSAPRDERAVLGYSRVYDGDRTRGSRTRSWPCSTSTSRAWSISSSSTEERWTSSWATWSWRSTARRSTIPTTPTMRADGAGDDRRARPFERAVEGGGTVFRARHRHRHQHRSMIAGNIGSEAIMSYTVIGDAVNLGARLESLNKEFGTRIIISEATRQQLKGDYEFRPLGDVVVKGKTHPVAIFEVVGPAASMASGINREARV